MLIEKSVLPNHPIWHPSASPTSFIRMYNAQQANNPFIIDNTIGPVDAITRTPWKGEVGLHLAFIAVQMKFRSLLWIEVPKGAKMDCIPFTPTTGSLPHSVLETVRDEVYHVSVFLLRCK